MIYEFGEFDLDLRQFQLRKSGEAIAVEPKVFDVLRYLVEHRERVVPKTELLAEVWPNDVVTDAVLPNNVAVLRKALGQTRRQKSPIETIHGRGYRFSAPVIVRADGAAIVQAAGGMQSGADPFVGRDALMARLAALARGAMEGRGRIVIVSGEAGMGKTRLLDELRASADPAIVVHASRCMPRTAPEGGAPALWPWIQLLRSCGAELPRDPDGGVSVPGGEVLGAVLPAFGAPQLPVGAPDFVVLDGLVRFFVGAAENRCRLLVVDDVHLADAASVQVLNLLSQEVLSSRLLVVVTQREGELPAGDATREALVALSRPRGVERVSLPALQADDVADYVGAALGPDLPEGLTDRVYEVTRGTPMYLRDVVEGLQNTAGEFDAQRYAEHGVQLSTAAYDYARQRVGRLPAEVVDTLSAAAVIGEGFRLRVLSALVARVRHELLDQMDVAVAAGIVEPDAARADGYVFKHPFLRAAIYEGLPAGVRVRTHRAAADALTECSPEPDHEVLCAIADHYYRSLPGHDPEPAIDYACRAGLAATYAQDYPSAVRMYGLAMEAVAFSSDADPIRRVRILRWLVRSNHDAGRLREARYLGTDLLETTRRHGLHEEFAAAVHVIAAQERYDLGRGAYPRALMDEALSRLPLESPYRPRLLIERARCRDLTRERRAELLDEALSLAGDNVAIALDCEAARVEVLTGPETVDPLIAAADAAAARWPEQAAQLDALVDPVARRRSLRAMWIVRYSVERSRCFALLTKGRVAQADRAAAACEEVADRSGWPLARFECGLYAVGRALSEADMAGASKRLEDVLATARGLAQHDAMVALVVLRERLRWMLGRRPVITEETLASIAREVPGIRGETLIGTAYLAMQCGYRGVGQRIFESLARDDFSDLPEGTPKLAALAELSHLCVATASVDLAAGLIERLQPLAHLCAVSRSGAIHGPLTMPLSQLCTLVGRHDDAVAHAQSALSSARALGMTAIAIDAGLTLCTALCARGGEGDQASVLVELPVVERLASRHRLLGLLRRAEDVRALVERAPDQSS